MRIRISILIYSNQIPIMYARLCVFVVLFGEPTSQPSTYEYYLYGLGELHMHIFVDIYTCGYIVFVNIDAYQTQIYY